MISGFSVLTSQAGLFGKALKIVGKQTFPSASSCALEVLSLLSRSISFYYPPFCPILPGSGLFCSALCLATPESATNHMVLSCIVVHQKSVKFENR
jgi:hypothetical protein